MPDTPPLPLAEVEHRIPGRMRLRVRMRRGDAGFFERTASLGRVPGVRGVLGVVPLGPLDLALTAAAGVLPYVANEALKAAQKLPAPADLRHGVPNHA